MSKPTTIVWFRRDFRLQDNPAWNHAVENGGDIIPLYIHSPKEDGKWARGGASNWWLHHALADLSEQLDNLGYSLLIHKADKAHEALKKAIKDSQAEAICWNRCYEPASVDRDTKIKKALTDDGFTVETFNGNLLFDPLKIASKSDTPYKVFTPFWKHCAAMDIKQPATAKARKAKDSQSRKLKGDSLDSLALLPDIPWDKEMQTFWDPTRKGGEKLLQEAIDKAPGYQDHRDIPSEDATSRLSPYLHFGQISPAEFHAEVLENCQDKDAAHKGILRQLFWREFSAHLLFHFPHTSDQPLREEYNNFPWKIDPAIVRKWQKGQTGYPIVDAGMRQLWATGWMHNRVRMIVASLLVKHLLQPWQEGAHWFWDTLVDADLPNNTMGWQWTAGSGADASPYFRVFNPIIQGKKFDPEGEYVKRWVPELKNAPAEYIHCPWEMEPLELQSTGITLGKDYPEPIISHEKGRQQALDAYQSFKDSQEN
ncbi:deoxyribodipyrimidine photo-lyase [Rubritalea halochordaticola]|uniref:Deoxyribodipyrimidine photo-lyase n=1 Tax=Rubritalea halochordaticola TaxID=714537 RepID=A0ABP9V7M6_9BACT